MKRPVVVCADEFPAHHAVLCCAAAEAHRRGAPLHVLVTARGTPGEHRTVLADALGAARAIVPDVQLVGRTGRNPVAEELREASAEAAVLVVPAASSDLDRVVASSFCPVLAVPDLPGTGDDLGVGNGAVVLGAAPWTDELVVEHAFAEAARRAARLIVVRAGAAVSADREARELEVALSVWKVVHPTVEVETVVAEDPTTDVLISLSRGARLLVLGRSTRGALLAGLVGSPVRDVLRAAWCPVLVVPPPGPPHMTLLPDWTHGWTHSNP